MIDIENEIFTEITTPLKSKFTNLYCTSVFELIPAKFPCVSIVEANNYTDIDTIDSSSKENYAIVMYEVNVYTNDTSGKKQQCKKIFAELDKLFIQKGFVRNMTNPINLDDATKYRIVARYSATVGRDNLIYRR